jgi:hypothetical protein
MNQTPSSFYSLYRKYLPILFIYLDYQPISASTKFSRDWLKYSIQLLISPATKDQFKLISLQSILD